MDNEPLKRRLGFRDSVAIIVGVVIGVGIFRVPAEVAAYLDSPAMMLLAWALGGFISLLGVLCYAELSSCFPQTGGTYVYLREAYGKLTGFLFGWVEITIFRAGSLAGVAYVFAAYLKSFTAFGPGAEKAIAILAIIFFTLLNIGGIRYGTGVQNVLSAFKVAILAAVSALILFSPAGPSAAPAVQAQGNSWFRLAPALIPVLWTYGGWHESTFMSGEFRDTKKALPLSLITSILLITGLYVLINYAYVSVMSMEEIRASKSIAADIFGRLYGKAGLAAMSLAVLVSAGGALNSYILTGARIPFAVARDLPRLAWLGTVHRHYDTPARSFVFNAVWASLLVLWGNFEELLFFTGFANWLFVGLAGAAVFVLRRRLDRSPDAFRMIGYPWVPALFTAVAVCLFLTTIFYAPRAALFGSLLLGAGVPIFFLMGGASAGRKKPEKI